MRICIIPEYPMSLMTGGLQVQAEETCTALNQLGADVSAELFNWSEKRPLPDVYHFIGFPRYLSCLSQLIHSAGRPYFITMLFGGRLSRGTLWEARLRMLAKALILRQSAVPEPVSRARGLITITQGDAHAARFLYTLPENRVHLVPNGVSTRFFAAEPGAWRRQYGSKPFVLCVGAIQRRKGQLLLVEACNQLELPVVLLGPVLPGEAAYAQDVRQAMQSNQQLGGLWRTDLRNEDELLVSAYAACRVHALLSSAETQPLSVMQAMAARKPVLLLKAASLETRCSTTFPPRTGQA